MSYSYNLKNKEVIDNIRSPAIYEFNLARNMALLSDDPAIIRYFYQVEAAKLSKDQWLIMNISDKFMAQYRQGQAYSYFGICPMIVKGKVNLLSSMGFKCESKDKEIDEILNKVKEDAGLDIKFAEGAYWESGIGDFAYRLSYSPEASDKPIVSVVEPHHLEVNYMNGKIKSFVIKEVADDDASYELREIYYKDGSGNVCITYRFYVSGDYISPDDIHAIADARGHFPEVDTSDRVLPLPDFPIIFKKNASFNQLYKGERGVPDIQGLDTIEDALTETLSDLIDAIRKGGVKEYVNQDMVPQDERGNDLRLDRFNKTVIYTRGGATPGKPEELFKVVQGDIHWEAYVKTIQTLMSTAINKAGLSPTTLGLTGLESINSSQESQDAREKPSMRTRKLHLKSWEKTLTELMNKYLQMLDYIEGRNILDYSGLIKIGFDEYNSPSQENITDVLVKQVSAGIKARTHAIKDLNPEYDEVDVQTEAQDILSEKSESVLQGGEPNSGQDMANSAPNNANSGSSNPINAKLENRTLKRAK